MINHRFSWAAIWVAALAIGSGTAAPVHAHPGGGLSSGLVDGAVHPLTGIDHLLAMVAVGLWAAQRGGRSAWALPAAFLVLMGVGGALGAAHVALPWVEPGIVASLLVLGMFVAAAVRLPLAASAAVVGVCALVHGHAHGAELPVTAAGLAYGIGFIGSSAGLILAGFAFATLWQRAGAPAAVRIAGALVAVGGLSLFLA